MFRFRLQRVLELREEHEQAKARELAGAKDAADAARREQDAIAALRDSSRAEIEAAQSTMPRVGHLHGLGFALQALDQRLQTAEETVQAAEVVVDAAQDALTSAARDRRVLDRLKERHVEAWRAEEAQKDRLQMDEIALARFGRGNEGGSASSESHGQQGNQSDSTVTRTDTTT